MWIETKYKNKHNGQIAKFVKAANPVVTCRSGKSKMFELRENLIKKDLENWEEIKIDKLLEVKSI